MKDEEEGVEDGGGVGGAGVARYRRERREGEGEKRKREEGRRRVRFVGRRIFVGERGREGGGEGDERRELPCELTSSAIWRKGETSSGRIFFFKWI